MLIKLRGARNESNQFFTKTFQTNMTTEQKEKIKNIIENSKSFGLFLKENAKDYEFLAREALKSFLEEKNKNTCSLPENPKEFIEKWSPVIGESKKNILPASNIIIHIPKDRTKIKEINYEDNGGALDLNIALENGNINPENIIIEQKNASFDAVFCLGCPPLEQPPENYKKLLPTKDKIIQIDQDEISLNEKVFKIINGIFNEPLDNKTATILFAGLVVERMCNYNQSKEKTQDTERSLMHYGAEKQNVFEIVSESLSLEQLPII